MLKNRWRIDAELTTTAAPVTRSARSRLAVVTGGTDQPPGVKRG